MREMRKRKYKRRTFRELRREAQLEMLDELLRLQRRVVNTLSYMPKPEKSVNFVIFAKDWQRFKLKYGGPKYKEVNGEQAR